MNVYYFTKKAVKKRMYDFFFYTKEMLSKIQKHRFDTKMTKTMSYYELVVYQKMNLADRRSVESDPKSSRFR